MILDISCFINDTASLIFLNFIFESNKMKSIGISSESSAIKTFIGIET